MGKEEQKLEQEEVEEIEEEEGVNLQARKSRSVFESKSTEDAAVDIEVSNGHVIQSTVTENGAKKEETNLVNKQKIVAFEGVLVNESEPLNGQQNSDNLVSYDKDEGVDSNCTHSGEQQFEKNAGRDKLEISSHEFVVQNNSTCTINNIYEGGLEDGSLSGSNLRPCQNSFQEHSTSYMSSKEIESADVDPINRDEMEVTELDVERVIQKQTTHDLYCPNCNSCITTRVILRKRKRRIRISDQEFKQNKIETTVDSKLATGSFQASSGRVHLTDDVNVGDTRIPTADDDECHRGPDIFRCLSCFSFFIPTGNGLKLFRIFGAKSRKENIQDGRESSVKKNGLASLFFSNKLATAVEQGSSLETDVQKSDVGVMPSSSSQGDQSGQTPLIQKTDTPAHASEGLIWTTANNYTLEGGDKILPFPSQQPTLNGNVLIGARCKLDETTTEKIDAKMEALGVYTSDPLKESKPSREVQVNRESDLSVTTPPNRTQVTKGESAEDTISFSQKGGLKFLISSNKGAQTLEDSEESQMPTQTIQLLGSGQVYPTEVSQHAITEAKFEVHSGDSLKVDSIPSVNGASVTKDEDTVITIDAQPARPSETAHGVIHPAETASGLPLATQISTVHRERTEMRKEFEIEVIKSIVYGGLAESIASLSVVSSAAAGDAATLNILALGMANLIGGLLIICHNLWELRCDHTEQVSNQVSRQLTEQRDRYTELLGRRENFILHAIVSILSYLIFGLVPPLVYGLSFRKSDDKELKLVVVAAASLLCIVVLAIGRAYVQRPPKPYLKSVVKFVMLGFVVCGVAYAAGILVERLLEKLGLFQSSSVANLLLPETRPTRPIGSAWASY